MSADYKLIKFAGRLPPSLVAQVKGRHCPYKPVQLIRLWSGSDLILLAVCTCGDRWIWDDALALWSAASESCRPIQGVGRRRVSFCFGVLALIMHTSIGSDTYTCALALMNSAVSFFGGFVNFFWWKNLGVWCKSATGSFALAESNPFSLCHWPGLRNCLL